MNLKIMISIFVGFLLVITVVLLFNFISLDEEEKNFEVIYTNFFDFKGNESGSFVTLTDDGGCIVTGYAD